MNNIEQMKFLIGQLEALGQVELADQIQALKDKVAELEAKTFAEAHALAEQVKVEAEQIGAELVTAEQNFVRKYGQIVAHGVEFFLLLMIAGKLLGAI